MDYMDSFLTHPTSLKVCGITTEADAQKLVDLSIPAMGINFWEKSKRYLAPEIGETFLPAFTGKILRVGVFVNAKIEYVLNLLENNLIDIAQFHGDETPEYCQQFKLSNYPFIKAIGVKNADSLGHLSDYGANTILLDAHAPDVYGGTGDTFDWNLAVEVQQKHPDMPIILAGGITAENAEDATRAVQPVALDVASGAEISPGIKDIEKVKAIQAGINLAVASTSGR